MAIIIEDSFTQLSLFEEDNIAIKKANTAPDWLNATNETEIDTKNAKHLALFIDIETYAKKDITTNGAYVYINDPDFKVILNAFSLVELPYDITTKEFTNKEELSEIIQTLQNAKKQIRVYEDLTEELVDLLKDDNVYIYAFNASFERLALSKAIDYEIKLDRIRCVQTLGNYFGLPNDLSGACRYANIIDGKLKEGKHLIRKIHRGEALAMNEFYTFCEYNKRDVELMFDLVVFCLKLGNVHSKFWQEYQLSEEINDNGILVDTHLLKLIDNNIERNFNENMEKLKNMTGLENPKSPDQMLLWIKQNFDSNVNSMAKDSVSKMLESPKMNDKVREVLYYYQELNKSSLGKVPAFHSFLCEDNKVRGTFKFYGAYNTGRFAGRGIQPQNLPRGTGDVDKLREDILNGKILTNDELSSLLRTLIIAPQDSELVVADFSAIEARVLAFISGEQWKLDIFNSGKDIYLATVNKMFNLNIKDKKDPLRQKGKIAELGCGYNGGVKAVCAMNGGDYKFEKYSEEEYQEMVKSWRKANPNIVKAWRSVERTINEVMTKGQNTAVIHNLKGISIRYKKVDDVDVLFFKLPSGRELVYYDYKEEPDFTTGWTKKTYKGYNTQKNIIVKTNVYGGLFIENITQAIARDILMEALFRLRKYNVIMHIHDEIVVVSKKEKVNEYDSISEQELCDIMSIIPEWFKGCPLNAEAFTSAYYKKEG